MSGALTSLFGRYYVNRRSRMDENPYNSPQNSDEHHESKSPAQRLYVFCWVLWLCGTALIALSWVRLVTPEIGWIGFGIALVGTFLSMFSHGAPR